MWINFMFIYQTKICKQMRAISMRTNFKFDAIRWYKERHAAAA